MNNWDWFLESPLIPAIGWTILHSIWQVFFLGAIAFLGLKLISSQKAQFRYLFSYSILLFIGGLFIWNFNHQYRIASLQKTNVELNAGSYDTNLSEQTQSPETNSKRNDLVIDQYGSENTFIQKGKSYPFEKFLSNSKNIFKKNLPWIALIWIISVLILGLKMIGSWLYLQHWTKRTAKPVATLWLNKLDLLKKRQGLDYLSNF